MNFEKLEKDVKIPSLVELSKIYQQVFSEFTYFQPSLEQKSELKDLLAEFGSILNILIKVKKLARNSFIAFSKYQESIAGLMNGIKEITPIFLINKNLNLASKENYVNPYLSLREWLRADILDIESMIEAINKYLSMEAEAQEIEAKIEKKKRSLEQINSGKKSISQRLSSKPTETRASEEEKKIANLEANKEALDIIISITIGRLLQNDILKFKQQKIYKICTTMRNYSSITVNEYQEIAEQILQIEENLSN